MAKNWTLPACFAHFGVVASHRHFSLSAVSSDGKTVVVAMWEDEFERHGDRIMYQTRYRPTFKGKLRRISNQWIANLKWACRHCDCLVRVVIIQAEDVQANTRRVKFCYPDNSLIMRITHLDTETGVYRAESTRTKADVTSEWGRLRGVLIAVVLTDAVPTAQ